MGVDPSQPHRGRLRGNDAVWDPRERIWRWADTGTPVDDARPCWFCARRPIGGKDACLAHLDGVTSACCGHGRDVGYILWPGQSAPGRWLAGVRLVDE